MRARSVDTSGTPGPVRRLGRRQVAALSLAGLLLLLGAAAALAATGDLTQPAGTAGCISETGSTFSGPCADGHALRGASDVAVSSDGKSVYVTSAFSSNAVVRLNRNPTTGAISQPAGAAGCISQNGVQGCADGHALRTPAGVAVSPDGKSVYVASYSSNAVVRLNRNPTTGAISQPAGAAGCISENVRGPCAHGHALVGPGDVAVSSDGKSVYVPSQPASHGDAVVRLNRNPQTGAISEPAGAAGCISDSGSGPCANGHALDGANSVAVSSDGKSVYATAEDNYRDSNSAVVRLNRNPTTGAISQPDFRAGCISETGAGPCAKGHGLGGSPEEFGGPFGVTVSPDGKSVYVTSSFTPPGRSVFFGAVVRLRRSTSNATIGRLSQPAGAAGCISQTGAGPCADGHGFDSSAASPTVSPDGRNVYLGALGVVRINRNPTTGAISQPAGTAGCVTDGGSENCATGHGIFGPFGVTVSPDGKSVYAAAIDENAVARLDRTP